MKEEKQIMYDSPESAKFVTGISGWVSREGYFWGKDEHMARWGGCTHMLCRECWKNIHRKGWTCCKDCRDKHADKRFESMDKKLWYNQSPVCCFDSDQYFFGGIEDVEEYCASEGVQIWSIQLVHCEPTLLPEIDINDHFCDVMAEEQDTDDIDKDILDAVELLIEAIRNAKPLSWHPTNKAVKFERIER